MGLFSFGKKQDPAELFKKATEQKRSGDIEGAIETLRVAYKAASKGHTGYGIDPYLKLGMYLHEAGRVEEALAELQSRLDQGEPGSKTGAEVIPMFNARIYDKMRLILQREKRFAEAASYGILSHVSLCCGLSLQDRKKELRSAASAKALHEVAMPLLKKGHDGDKINQVVEATE